MRVLTKCLSLKFLNFSIFKLLNNLRNSDKTKSGRNTAAIYKLALKNFNQIKNKDAAVKHAKPYLFARKGAETDYRPAGEVYYADNHTVPLRVIENVWLLNLQKRSGERQVREFLGTKTFENLRPQIILGSVVINQYVQREFNEWMQQARILILAFRIESLKMPDEKQNAADLLEDMEIVLVDKCDYLVEDIKRHQLNESEFINEGKRFFFRTPETCNTFGKLERLTAFRDAFAEMLCVLFRVTELKNDFRNVIALGLKDSRHILETEHDSWVLKEATELSQVSLQAGIYFNDQGQLQGNLPQELLPANILQFNISGKNLVVEQQKLIVAQAKKALVRVEKIMQNRTEMDVLEKVYNITPGDLGDLETDFKNIIAGAAGPTYDYIPTILPGDNYYNVHTDDTDPANDINFQAKTTTPFTDNCDLLYPDQNALNFSLTRTELYKKKTFDWITKGGVTFDQPITTDQIKKLTVLNTALSVELPDLKSLLDEANNPKSHQNRYLSDRYQRIQKALLKARADIAKVDDLIDMSDDRAWVMHWFWYGDNEMPSLNPFPFFKDEDITPVDTSGLSSLRMKVLTRQNFLKNIDYSKHPESIVDKYINQIETSSKTINQTLKDYQKSVDQKNNNQKYISDFTATTTGLNKGILIVSDIANNNPIFWMRHHDALNQGEDMNIKSNKEYTEDDRIIIITHNLTTNQQAAVSLVYKPIANDETSIADDLKGLPLTTLPDLNFIFLDAHIDGLNSVELLRQNTLTTNINTLLPELQDDITSILSMQYILNQKNPPTDLKETTDPPFTYHSQKDKTPVVQGAQQAVYTVSVVPNAASATATTTSPATQPTPAATAVAGSAASSTATTTAAATTTTTKSSIPVDTFKYRVNKLYRIFPMAGIAYSFNRFVSVSPNSTQTGPGAVSSLSQTNFIIGLKVFIHKTDIRNDSIFYSRDAHGKSIFWSRFHIDAAVNLPTPLSNLYLGAGLDLWPGLSVNTGLILNRYTYYSYSGGVQNNNAVLYRPGIYLGLSTDVAIISQLAKLLNLSK